MLENDSSCKLIITQQQIKVTSENELDFETYSYYEQHADDFKYVAGQVAKTIKVTNDILGELKALYFIKNQVKPTESYKWQMIDDNTFVGIEDGTKLRVSNSWNTDNSNKTHSTKGLQKVFIGKWAVGIYQSDDGSYEIVDYF